MKKRIMNHILIPALLLSLLPFAANAGQSSRSFRVSAGDMSFVINGEANHSSFVIAGKEGNASEDADFWRLILDDGFHTEIPVCSSLQNGKVSVDGNVLSIQYDSLVSDQGRAYDIKFNVRVENECGLLRFTPSVSNNAAGVRVNECFCPMADFKELCGERTKDVLYLPDGLGRCHSNPWGYLESLTPAYYSHDEKETFIHLSYPRATMGWYGVQSGSKFLYVARYDDEFRYCFLTVHHKIHGENLMFGVDHFPMAKCGETLTEPSTVIGLIDGDWRAGAREYRKWADRNFFKVRPKADWVKDMTGWQRIIMRSQYGEDYYKAEDLPALYEAGAKYGIKTLFLFAWWKEGMDRGYPAYDEPYPGAFKALSENIRKVQEMGGRVILECNCHFLDPKSDFYRQYGDLVKIIDINGNEVRPSFVYYGRGELRETYGSVQFPIACSGTEMWRNQVLSQLKMMGDLGADCVFADCFGGCPYQPCFNERHEHGNRIDEEWIYHRKFFDSALKYCNGSGKVLGTEVVTDIAASYAEFVHGLVNADFKIKGNDFPQLFRYTFPEVITTERNIYCSEGDFAKQLKYALTLGVRLDAQLWVCRADLGKDVKYAEAIGFYTDCLNSHRDFFYDGKFTVIDSSKLPYYVKRGEFLNADGSKVMRILYNASDSTVEACGATLSPDEVKFDEFDYKLYCRGK
jgi:hypothetical protein